MYPSWHFREMSKKEMNVDPTEEAFFTTETLSEAAASLARECYQNTMDAVKEGQTARIRIFFSGEENSLASEIGKKYLGELPSHIEANDLPEIPSFDNKIKFIVIEDFGTNGLRGKIEQTDDEDTESIKTTSIISGEILEDQEKRILTLVGGDWVKQYFQPHQESVLSGD